VKGLNSSLEAGELLPEMDIIVAGAGVKRKHIVFTKTCVKNEIIKGAQQFSKGSGNLEVQTLLALRYVFILLTNDVRSNIFHTFRFISSKNTFYFDFYDCTKTSSGIWKETT